MQSKVEQLYQAFEATKAELDKTKTQFDNEKNKVIRLKKRVSEQTSDMTKLNGFVNFFGQAEDKIKEQLRRIEEAHVKIKKSEKEDQDWIVTSTKCKEETLKMVTLMATNDKTQTLTIADFETTTESLKTRVESTKSESDDQIKIVKAESEKLKLERAR